MNANDAFNKYEKETYGDNTPLADMHIECFEAGYEAGVRDTLSLQAPKEKVTMTIEEFKKLSIEYKKKWLTEYWFQKQKYEIEAYGDYSILHFHLKEEVDRLANESEELLVLELQEEIDFFPKFKHIVNLLED